MIATIMFLVIIADQYIKKIIVDSFNFGESYQLIGNFFTITYTRNTGIAFGLFKGNNILMILLIVSIITLFLAYISYNNYRSTIIKISTGMIAGGAAGNLIDRITRGYIVDYLNFSFWPAFNLADSFIVIGGIILAIYLVFNIE